jgi:hypothetical protein
MRELVSDTGDRGSEIGDRKAERRETAVAAGPQSPISDPQSPIPNVWHGIAQLLEATCAALSDPATQDQIPPEIRDRLRAALRRIASQLDADSQN